MWKVTKEQYMLVLLVCVMSLSTPSMKSLPELPYPDFPAPFDKRPLSPRTRRSSAQRVTPARVYSVLVCQLARGDVPTSGGAIGGFPKRL